MKTVTQEKIEFGLYKMETWIVIIFNIREVFA